MQHLVTCKVEHLCRLHILCNFRNKSYLTHQLSFQDEYLKTKFENLIECPCVAGCSERGVQSQDNQEDRRWEDSIGGGSYATGKSRTDKNVFTHRYTNTNTTNTSTNNRHRPHTTLIISLIFHNQGGRCARCDKDTRLVRICRELFHRDGEICWPGKILTKDRLKISSSVEVSKLFD